MVKKIKFSEVQFPATVINRHGIAEIWVNAHKVEHIPYVKKELITELETSVEEDIYYRDDEGKQLETTVYTKQVVETKKFILPADLPVYVKPHLSSFDKDWYISEKYTPGMEYVMTNEYIRT